MLKVKFVSVLLAGIIGAIAGQAPAAITVVNLDTGNTSAPGWTYNNIYTDAQGGDLIYVLSGDSAADWSFTQSGLASGTYNVYLYYFQNGGTYSKLSTAGTFTLYDTTTVGKTVWGSNANYVYAPLGTTASAVTGFTVDFRHIVDNGASYVDAVGYELVPEPASFGILACGAVGLLMRRRKA